MQKPETARQIIESLPFRFRKEKSAEANYSATIHFQIEGNNGGEFTVVINGGEIELKEGLHGTAKCTINAKENNYCDIEWGRQNPQMAFMMGKVKADNVMELMTFTGMFRSLERAFGA